jgi:hypothetical protein
MNGRRVAVFCSDVPISQARYELRKDSLANPTLFVSATKMRPPNFLNGRSPACGRSLTT